jgi:hypothetical protein
MKASGKCVTYQRAADNFIKGKETKDMAAQLLCDTAKGTSTTTMREHRSTLLAQENEYQYLTNYVSTPPVPWRE